MTVEDAIVRLLEPGGAIARRLPGYAPRRAQIDMALEVATALRTPYGRLVVEAGTGTGKSLAYLVAALVSEQQVVVATGTKALQEQLLEKDLPVVLAAVREELGLDKQAALMKGRGNYLCLARFEHFEQAPRFAFAEEATAWPALRAWAAKTEVGDRAELESLPDAFATWSDLDASSESCVGQRCPRYADCFVTKMRRRAEAADLIVVNHHLLCADQRVRLEGLPKVSEAPGEAMADGFAQVIPTADALIVDEAHALPDVATEYFGVSLASTRIERLLKDLKKTAEGLPTSRRLAVLGAGQRVQAAFDQLYRALEPLAAGQERARLTDGHRRAFEEARDLTVETTDELCGQLEALLEADAGGGLATYAVGEVEGLSRRSGQVAEELAFVLGPALEDRRFVAFVEGRRRGLSLGAVPIDVADALAKTLFGAHKPVVLTSATLAVASDTRAFEEKAGLRRAAKRPFDRSSEGGDDPGVAEDETDEAVRSVLYPSPFDHKHRAALYAPAGMPEPDDPRFTAAFDEELSFLLELSRGGALCLFTSHRAMEGAFARLAPALAALGLASFKQGDAPKAHLLEELRARDGGEGAVLFATHSFWEGVDVRGRALRLVAIDRLPFRIPTDPVQVARQELVKARGGHPFRDLSLPEAALTLKQGAGRLLRSVDDAGVVAVLDGRLRKRPYGRVLLETLPPMTRVGSRKVLADFWRRYVAPPLGLSEGAEGAAPSTEDEALATE